MKQRWAHINDLNVDVMKDIMIFVAKSEDGAANFARTIPVCKAFSDFAKDAEVLKAVVFEKERISEYDGSFWQIDGLLSKCARAGNMAACNILLKYLEERMETSKEIVTAIEELKKEFQDRMVAVRNVYSRGRMRAARSALNAVAQKILEAQRDSNEIGKQLARFKFAAYL